MWDSDGRLMYADANHPDAEKLLPTAELRRALAGEHFVLADQASLRGIPVLEVFVLADPDRAGTIDGIAEVILPQSAVTSAVQASTQRLYVAAPGDSAHLVVVVGDPNRWIKLNCGRPGVTRSGGFS